MELIKFPEVKQDKKIDDKMELLKTIDNLREAVEAGEFDTIFVIGATPQGELARWQCTRRSTTEIVGMLARAQIALHMKGE